MQNMIKANCNDSSRGSSRGSGSLSSFDSLDAMESITLNETEITKPLITSLQKVNNFMDSSGRGIVSKPATWEDSIETPRFNLPEITLQAPNYNTPPPFNFSSSKHPTGKTIIAAARAQINETPTPRVDEMQRKFGYTTSESPISFASGRSTPSSFNSASSRPYTPRPGSLISGNSIPKTISSNPSLASLSSSNSPTPLLFARNLQPLAAIQRGESNP